MQVDLSEAYNALIGCNGHQSLKKVRPARVSLDIDFTFSNTVNFHLFVWQSLGEMVI